MVWYKALLLYIGVKKVGTNPNKNPAVLQIGKSLVCKFGLLITKCIKSKCSCSVFWCSLQKFKISSLGSCTLRKNKKFLKN